MLVAALGCTLADSAPHAHGPGDWIDVHVHLFADKGALADFDEAARRALQIMDAERIRTMLVMSPPRAREGPDCESLVEITKKYRPRFAMLGGGGTLNPMLQEAGQASEVSEELRRKFEHTAERLIASGARGFGEIAAHHLSLAPGHPYEAVPPDHPLLRLLADIAARHGAHRPPPRSRAVRHRDARASGDGAESSGAASQPGRLRTLAGAQPQDDDRVGPRGVRSPRVFHPQASARPARAPPQSGAQHSPDQPEARSDAASRRRA